ncbi:uncharacterized protein [Clytia hemisphaerica]|uniref:uncharacterized protein isoform X1 n=1 Tax=Clytia hemisphaerica TaxID=252671 RepID=UPI0034D613E7
MNLLSSRNQILNCFQTSVDKSSQRPKTKCDSEELNFVDLNGVNIISIWLLLVLQAKDTSSNTLDIKYSKQELVNLLESLSGGEDSSVPDFLFFSKERLENYTDTKGPPRNRTELRREDRPNPKNRTDAERTLAKAQNHLSRGKDVQVITRWARILDMLLFEDLDPEIQECTAIKTLGGIKPEVQPCGKSKKIIIRKVRRRKQQQKKKREELAIQRKKKRQEALMKKRKREELIRIQPSLEELEDIKHILEDNLEDENAEEEQDENLEEDEDEEGENRFKRSSNQPQNDQPKTSNHHRSRRSLVQNLDVVRMRRSLSYTYSNEGSCFVEGSEGSTSDTILLCETCYKTVDFGESVVPQYANSVECSDSATICISGDGTCTQKVIYYSFKKLVDSVSNTWESYQQPLNVSCECECIANSMTHMYMVGDSN